MYCNPSCAAPLRASSPAHCTASDGGSDATSDACCDGSISAAGRCATMASSRFNWYRRLSDSSWIIVSAGSPGGRLDGRVVAITRPGEDAAVVGESTDVDEGT